MAITINGTTGVAGVDGSASTPALQGSDTNTGVSFGTDTVNINTGGTTRYSVDSSGNIQTGSVGPAFTGSSLSYFSIKAPDGGNRYFFGEIGNSASAQLSLYDSSDSQKIRLSAGSGATFFNGENVGIGTSSPGAKLQVNDTNPVIAEFYHSDGGTNDEARIALGAYSSNPPSQRGVLLTALNNGAGHDFLVSTSPSHSGGPTSKLRVGFDGSTSFFTTSGNGAAVFTTDISAGTSYNLFQGRYGASSITSNGTQCFFVTTNGNTYNANNVFASGSDLKLKENIVDAKSQWDDIKALKIRNFNFKNDSDKVKMLGVVAQELEAAGMKGLVDDHVDIDADGKELETVTKSVKYSILYMKAIKALQEAITKIETLETKVAALEAA